jgi:uncharacterized protein YndB with AHSA1/START domain
VEGKAKMSNTIQGYILIADITGYTIFLNQSELEHAQKILQSLLEVLIQNTKLPLVISRLEGDAVISYAPKDSFLQGATVMEMVESCYVAFKRAIDLMVINTSCGCNACRNMPKLDLKFFIHFGTFGLQPLASYTELIGNDVNLIHRLTKNHVREKTGLEAYLLLTQAAVEVLGIQELSQEMQPLSEDYPYIGEVEVFVQDMQPVWERERERSRLMVTPEQAFLTAEYDFPVTPVQLWDYLIMPEYRALFLGADRIETEKLSGGRIGQGTVYQCAHGDTIHPQTIVDWQPFETHTILDEGPPILSSYITCKLAPNEKGSHLTILVKPVEIQNRLKRLVGHIMLRTYWRVMSPKGMDKLRQRIEEERTDGTLPQVEAVDIDLEEIRSSIRAGLGLGDKKEETTNKSLDV